MCMCVKDSDDDGDDDNDDETESSGPDSECSSVSGVSIEEDECPKRPKKKKNKLFANVGFVFGMPHSSSLLPFQFSHSSLSPFVCLSMTCLSYLQAACAVCIRVGSFHDPPEVPGLAHLLEHSKFVYVFAGKLKMIRQMIQFFGRSIALCPLTLNSMSLSSHETLTTLY